MPDFTLKEGYTLNRDKRFSLRINLEEFCPLTKSYLGVA
jgi:hypothetical protein